ncbi:winged helix-turn-helix domain-containing protein [Kitasatospora sp. NBC_01287]|uniref:ArsR/SmtB family transcription factor n=1 Tax=Kitasatospora sp. NBC_01287 TaxID=2903573 RepID=UPI0022592CF6|nr:winged helix-turn-helix domain-containing protein [Kitasatospora sp. NBC_01287]MCX4747240.1 winged helix-turn-helix domain-containing protein [Kitasatospora sp. NBC_01287]
MSSNPSTPDYELADRLELTTAEQVRAISDPLRTTLLGLLHERAATVTELAGAVKRPKSTVAHHVGVLARAGLLRVVRTRRVRAIEERYYGRAARMFYVGLGRQADGVALPPDFNDFEVAAKESNAAYELGQLRGFIRHARLSEERAAEFWQRIDEVIHEFDRLPRSGERVYGFAVGLYPMLDDYPVLPDPQERQES